MTTLMNCSANGAPEVDVEVTPEMIRAGLDAFYENAACGWETPGRKDLIEMLEEVFRAMAKSAPTFFRSAQSSP